ncbi:MAG: hypothetical protein B6I38_04745 [Anaerolineaceae bacterium 4572_5.1]|nr:MAG: hypothetical protein B6I38_04745 [Anaerolineaceae bacterium 4572_5.1]
MTASDRAEAIRLAQKTIAQNPVYLDTETTGFKKNDVIVEISIIDHDGSPLVDTLVKPNKHIPYDAIEIHHITNEMVQIAPTWAEVWPEVEAAIAGRVVGIYNADFDIRLIKQTHAHNQMRWSKPNGASFFDIMEAYAQFYGQWNSRHGNYRWQSLEKAGVQCGLSLPNSHRALDDTLLTRAVLHYMAKQGEQQLTFF